MEWDYEEEIMKIFIIILSFAEGFRAGSHEETVPAGNQMQDTEDAVRVRRAFR